MDNSSSAALIIFIRNPELGKVKTRLAKSVGNEKALAIYKSLLAHTRSTVLQVDVNRLLFYADKLNHDDAWSSADFIKFVQVDEDLGGRMHRAFVTALENNLKAVIVGSDLPQINAQIIQEAFQKLDEYPYVIGPAVDGGYYLLGMKQPSPELFEDMEWSTPLVFEQTIRKIKKMGKLWYELPKISDVDYLEDWQKYGWKL
jgi:rSAM/selenodomain-associated transferase 1